ncbi:thioesterase II family protein [Vibrio sp. MEBiC08052]|uniref:thioesterase II family protein n=1 Tax=Vibrio sp. MEBiC08052 TaxID=1761910 RepID=UPI0007405FB6|nr:alpha/beta fold hydrolase [Vibrio sp. MEBiC08052]KUI97646.1 thioesterase [Vibrio sp. MEBiC08052]
MDKPIIFCFPHAGGGAHQYLSWQNMLPQDITWRAVDRAGRYSRTSEQTQDSFEHLVQDLVEQLLPDIHKAPFALFGHSMGGALAFEVTKELEMKGLYPKCLFISSAVSPLDRDKDEIRFFELEDQLFLDHILGGRDEVNRAVLQIFLQDIRDEYKQYHQYSPDRDSVLETPIVALCGEDEPINVTMDNWQNFTRKFHGVFQFPGSHFYWKENLVEVAALISNQMKLKGYYA